MRMNKNRTIPEWRIPKNNDKEINKGRFWKDNPCCPEVIKKQLKRIEIAKRYETLTEELS